MLELRSIYKTFRDESSKNPVIEDLNLTINTNESMVIIGPSGVGKSVLMKILLNIIPIDSGEILFNKKNIYKIVPDIKFGVLFQGGALFDSMNILENVTFPLNQHNTKKYTEKQIQSLAMEHLISVGFSTNVATKYPSELSGGMQKRVALARAIITKPDIMIFDEPTTGLDPITGLAICKLIRKTLDDLNITSITITHDMNVVKNVATRVGVFFNKKIVHECLPTELKDAQNEIAQHFYSAFYGS